MMTLSRMEVNQKDILKRLSSLENVRHDSQTEKEQPLVDKPFSSFDEFIEFDRSLNDKDKRKQLVRTSCFNHNFHINTDLIIKVYS